MATENAHMENIDFLLSLDDIDVRNQNIFLKFILTEIECFNFVL